MQRNMEVSQFEIQQMAQQVQQMRQELQDKSRNYNASHPDMVQLNEAIRRADNEMRASVEQLKAQQASHNQGGSFLAALVAAGYGSLSVDEIIPRAAQCGRIRQLLMLDRRLWRGKTFG